MDHLAGIDLAYRHFGDQPFEIADLLNMLTEGLHRLLVPGKILHSIQTLLNRLAVFQRKDHPAPQLSRPHGRNRLIQHVQ